MSTVDAFAKNLPEMLCSMSLDGRKFICIAELRDRRYVQFLVKSSWHIYAEVVSNVNIGDDATSLSTDDEDCLRKLGFHEPAPDRSPNWHRVITDSSGFLPLVRATVIALSDALHAQPGDQVAIRTWREEPFEIEKA